MKIKMIFIILLLIIISGCNYNTDEPSVIIDDSYIAFIETSPPAHPIPTEPPPTQPLPTETQPLLSPQPPLVELPLQYTLPPHTPTAPPLTAAPFEPSANAAHSIKILETFLGQYTSMFFYVVSYRISAYVDEPVIVFHWRDVVGNDGQEHSEVYFTDFNGDIIEDVPFIQNLYGAFSEALEKPAAVAASAFHIYTVEGSDIPLLIVMRFCAFQFTGGGYVIFTMFDDSTEFIQLGSMISWWSGGGGIPILAPYINESSEIIAYMFAITSGILYQLNNENIFEYFWMFDTSTLRIDMDGWHSEPVLADDFTQMLIDFEANQNAATNYRELLTDLYHCNFVPMVRMYDLENYLYEKIRQQLRGTFPIVDVNQNNE